MDGCAEEPGRSINYRERVAGSVEGGERGWTPAKGKRVGTETNPSQRGYERYERVGEPVDGDFDYYSRSSGDCLLSLPGLLVCV